MPRAELLERVDFLRLDASRRFGETAKTELGQFFTPAPIARLMASMLQYSARRISILDPGAGVGSLFAACVVELCSRTERPEEIVVTAYEIDARLAEYLDDTATLCSAECRRQGIRFSVDIRREDFIRSAAEAVTGGLFASSALPDFGIAILNPPYRKINTDSEVRLLLRRLGVETSNLYTGFLAAAVRLLRPGGELVAITPRSFCNGTYFRPFRQFFLREMALRRLHMFETRNHAFQEDSVLQENLILHAVKGVSGDAHVSITSSHGPEDDLIAARSVAYDEVVRPDDPNQFIHVVPDALGRQVAEGMAAFRSSLTDLGLTVSTGRVVDFRAVPFLRAEAGSDTVPLIYPAHFTEGYVAWPNARTKKPNAIVLTDATFELLVPSEHYVLVKRFSAKEERRRIVAAVYDADRIPTEQVGFENHLNYYHRAGRGLPLPLARGLAVFLNSTLVDAYFRQFNGHTQVNAGDLRSLPYPTEAELHSLGERVGDPFPSQENVDRLVEELIRMADPKSKNAPKAMKRVNEALAVLKDLGLPREQQNERSALTLLALLDLKPVTPWSDARNPLCGITPMMEFFAEHYGKTYAPNTRETVRRQTVHQFLDAGLIVANPDDPERPVNSGKNVYQIEASALELLRTYGTEAWSKDLRAYLASVETLKKRYAREREMVRIPLKLAPGREITLSPGGQNVLIREIIEQFAPRFTPGGMPLYVGDTDEKWAYFDPEGLAALGITVEAHGKMPDVIIHHAAKNWLVLIEAVTSHGPVNPKRRDELKRLFKGSRAGLVFVTAFLTRKAMMQYLNEIDWETEVWIADAPTHLIHFNGERFLGPYDSDHFGE